MLGAVYTDAVFVSLRWTPIMLSTLFKVNDITRRGRDNKIRVCILDHNCHIIFDFHIHAVLNISKQAPLWKFFILLFESLSGNFGFCKGKIVRPVECWPHWIAQRWVVLNGTRADD